MHDYDLLVGLLWGVLVLSVLLALLGVPSPLSGPRRENVARYLCPACKRGEHGDCWGEEDPPPGVPPLRCPCTHESHSIDVEPF